MVRQSTKLKYQREAAAHAQLRQRQKEAFLSVYPRRLIVAHIGGKPVYETTTSEEISEMRKHESPSKKEQLMFYIGEMQRAERLPIWYRHAGMSNAYEDAKKLRDELYAETGELVILPGIKEVPEKWRK